QTCPRECANCPLRGRAVYARAGKADHAQTSSRNFTYLRAIAMNPMLASLHRLLAISLVALAALPLPAGAANPNKVIHHVFPAAETGFDPAGVHDLYSGTIVQAVFETLLTYDYLARPSKLIPMTAEALPHVTDQGKTYTFKLKKGIYFTPDAAFKGQKRELVA